MAKSSPGFLGWRPRRGTPLTVAAGICQADADLVGPLRRRLCATQHAIHIYVARSGGATKERRSASFLNATTRAEETTDERRYPIISNQEHRGLFLLETFPANRNVGDGSRQ